MRTQGSTSYLRAARAGKTHLLLLLAGFMFVTAKAQAALNLLVEDTFTEGAFCGFGFPAPGWIQETPTGSARRRCCPDSATSCLRIDDTSTTDNLAVVRPLTAPAGRFTVEYRVRLAQTNARMDLGALLDSQHRRGVRVYFTNDGRIRIYEGGVTTNLQNYTANTWYKIKYVADTFTKRFDVYIDDVLKKRAMPFNDQAVTLSLLSFHTEGSTTGTAWIDDVKIWEGGVLSLPTIQVLETFDGAPQGSPPAGWSVSSGVSVVTLPSSTSDRGVQILGSATGNRSVARVFTPLSGKVTAEFWARTSLTNQTIIAGRLSDASIQAVDLYFGNDGNIRVISGNTSLVVQPYQANKWYRFKVVADTNTDRLDIHVDGVLKVAGAAFDNNVTAIRTLAFLVTPGTGSLLFDDVAVANEGSLLIDTFGSTASFTGNPIGGGEGYDRLVTGAVNHLVNAPSCGATNHAVCLRQALVNASAGQIVYVDDAMDIDVCGVLVADSTHVNLVSLVVKAGVTLASGRGKIINGMLSPGARLHCGTRNIVMLQVQGTGARITGLRLDGEYPFTSAVDQAGAIAAESIFNGGIGDVAFELDNNEIYGWSWFGAWMQRGDVHHNYFHENKRNERGYGVLVRGLTTPLITRIEANLFNDNRHAIAASGLLNDRYEAFHNTVVFNNSNGHTFDMHGSSTCNGCAGDYFKIQYNTFENPTETQESIHIRGFPLNASVIDHNWFYDGTTTQQRIDLDSTTNVTVGVNQYNTGAAIIQVTGSYH